MMTAAGVSSASNETSAVPSTAYKMAGSLSGPVVGMASNPQGTGYWLVNSLGDISTHGAVTSFGSTSSFPLNAPIVAIVAETQHATELAAIFLQYGISCERVKEVRPGEDELRFAAGMDRAQVQQVLDGYSQAKGS